jgi:hypothetical protein
MVTFLKGFPLLLPHSSIFLTTSQPCLIHISDPTQPECRGSCTLLKGFRAFEEFESIFVDSGHCVYLLVVCDGPGEREIDQVSPKP